MAHGRQPKGFPSDLLKVARRKLQMIEAAPTLETLKVSPGNHLHALREDRVGQYAIRVNDQFRICFRWTDAEPADVEITDYH